MNLKNVNLKKAREKIEEMENNLKALSEENELLKKKFDQENQDSPVDLILSHKENRESDNLTLRHTQISYRSNGEHRFLVDSHTRAKLSDRKERGTEREKKSASSKKSLVGEENV